MGATGQQWECVGPLLALSIQIKDETEIAINIDAIKLLLTQGTPIFHIYIGTIVELLGTLPPKFKVQVDGLLAALKCAKTY